MSEGPISKSLLLREKRPTVIDDVYFKKMCGHLEHLEYSPRNNNLKRGTKRKTPHHLSSHLKLYADGLANNSAPFLSHSKVNYLWQHAYALYESCLMKNEHAWGFLVAQSRSVNWQRKYNTLKKLIKQVLLWNREQNSKTKMALLNEKNRAFTVESTGKIL